MANTTQCALSQYLLIYTVKCIDVTINCVTQNTHMTDLKSWCSPTSGSTLTLLVSRLSPLQAAVLVDTGLAVGLSTLTRKALTEKLLPVVLPGTIFKVTSRLSSDLPRVPLISQITCSFDGDVVLFSVVFSGVTAAATLLRCRFAGPAVLFVAGVVTRTFFSNEWCDRSSS